MGRYKSFYKTKKWQEVRKYVIARDLGLCQKCKRKGKIKAGKQVHHKEELTDENLTDWNIALNPNNLETLCDECHAAEHNPSCGLSDFTRPPIC